VGKCLKKAAENFLHVMLVKLLLSTDKKPSAKLESHENHHLVEKGAGEEGEGRG
jgi:hypothetical protein